MENTRELDIKMVLALDGEIEERQDPIAGSVTYGRVPSIGIDDFRPMYSLQFTQNWGLTGPLINKYKPEFRSGIIDTELIYCDLGDSRTLSESYLIAFCMAFVEY